MKSAILSHLMTACVCVPTTAYIAPKVHHAIQRHRAATHPVVRKAAVPVIRVAAQPCVPVAPITTVGPLAVNVEPLTLDLTPQDTPQTLARLVSPGSPGPVLLVPDAPPGPDVGPIPEPATWTTMVIGFGAIGTAMRAGKAKDARA